MTRYKFALSLYRTTETVQREDKAFIPFDMDNTDYQQFLKDWEAGATVLSSTGVPLPWGSDPS